MLGIEQCTKRGWVRASLPADLVSNPLRNGCIDHGIRVCFLQCMDDGRFPDYYPCYGVQKSMSLTIPSQPPLTAAGIRSLSHDSHCGSWSSSAFFVYDEHVVYWNNMIKYVQWSLIKCVNRSPVHGCLHRRSNLHFNQVTHSWISMDVESTPSSHSRSDMTSGWPLVFDHSCCNIQCYIVCQTMSDVLSR